MIPFHLVLLAGGTGSRMGAELPKQLLPLGQKKVIDHSLDLFSQIEGLQKIVIVLDERYAHHLKDSYELAPPGKRRQDSLENALKMLPEDDLLICVHDAARPFVSLQDVERLLQAGQEVGAATLCSPVPFTIKQADDHLMVEKTLNRDTLYDIKTPQVVSHSILKKGFALCHDEAREVTDDVALAEILGHRVKLVIGSNRNIKLTTKEDYAYAKFCLQNP